MAKKTTKIGQEKSEAMIGTRVPLWVRRYYERQAENERRKLSDVIRIILVDNAKRAA